MASTEDRFENLPGSFRNSATFAAYLEFEGWWVTRFDSGAEPLERSRAMTTKTPSENNARNKQRRHAYRGYGSPLWEEGHGGSRRWGRWSADALLPEAGLPEHASRESSRRN